MATLNTISGQLERVVDSIEKIQSYFRWTGLKIPAGRYWDFNTKAEVSLDSGNILANHLADSKTYKTYSGNLEYKLGVDALAATVRQMRIENYLETDASNTVLIGNQTISAGQTIKIPMGFNCTPFTITANTLGVQLTPTTAQASHIFYNKTAYVQQSSGADPVKITGTLAKVFLPNTNKINNGNLQVALAEGSQEFLTTNIPYNFTQATEPSVGSSTVNGVVGATQNLAIQSYEVYQGQNATGNAGYYDRGWHTNILYDPINSDQTIKIKKVKGADGEEATTVNTLIFKAGYYSKDIQIKPVVEDVAGNTEDVLNYTDINLGGDFQFSGNQLLLNPDSYNGKHYDYFGKVVINQAVSSVKDDGSFVVSTGGWINSGDYGKAFGGLKPLSVENIVASNSTQYTNKDGFTLNSNKFTINIPAGYTKQPISTIECQVKRGVNTITQPADIQGMDQRKRNC